MSLKTFSFLIEPSSYTTDIVENIYKKVAVDYVFFQNKPLIAQSDKHREYNSLENMGLLKKYRFLIHVWKEYDFIIFNGYNKIEFIFLFLLNKLNRKKKYIALDSDTQYRKTIGFKGFLKQVYLNMIFEHPFLLGFAGGTGSHKELFRHYGMDEERIFLMPMMVNNETFYFDGEKPKKPFVFLYVGRIIPHKNVEFLIKSFRKTFGEQEDVLLRIVGRGESLDVLKSKYEKEKNIQFEGAKFAEDLVRVYHSSHVLVLPSLYEPWGLVVNEAMSASMPVLASDRVGAVGDLIKEGETGFVFNPQNEDQLSDLMKRVYEDRTLFTRLSKNARELMQKKWNYDLYMKNLKKALFYVEERVENRG